MDNFWKLLSREHFFTLSAYNSTRAFDWWIDLPNQLNPIAINLQISILMNKKETHSLNTIDKNRASHVHQLRRKLQGNIIEDARKVAKLLPTPNLL